MNYKIAIQFFGHLRTFEQCATSIKKYILSKYDCDVFVHTWSDTEHSTQTWHNSKSKIRPINQSMLNKIVKIYNPKMILVEKQIVSDDDTLIACLHDQQTRTISANGMSFMLQSQIKVNKLRKQYSKKNNTKYDMVIMLRPDIYLHNSLDINQIIHQCYTSLEYPARICANNALKKNGSCAFISDMLTDVLFMAKPSDMELIVDALKTIKFKNHTTKMWTPESLITDILFKKGISTLSLFYFFNRDFEIIRGSYYGKEKRRRFISFKLTPKLLRLNLFSFIKKNILSLDFYIFNVFNVDISIGKPYAKC